MRRTTLDFAPTGVGTGVGTGRHLLARIKQVGKRSVWKSRIRTYFGIWYIEILVGMGHGVLTVRV